MIIIVAAVVLFFPIWFVIDTFFLHPRRQKNAPVCEKRVSLQMFKNGKGRYAVVIQRKVGGFGRSSWLIHEVNKTGELSRKDSYWIGGSNKNWQYGGFCDATISLKGEDLLGLDLHALHCDAPRPDNLWFCIFDARGALDLRLGGR